MTVGPGLLPAIEAQIAELRNMLEPLESGRLRVGEWSAGAKPRDITHEQVGRIKGVIGELERVRDRMKADMKD